LQVYVFAGNLRLMKIHPSALAPASIETVETLHAKFPHDWGSKHDITDESHRLLEVINIPRRNGVVLHLHDTERDSSNPLRAIGTFDRASFTIDKAGKVKGVEVLSDQPLPPLRPIGILKVMRQAFFEKEEIEDPQREISTAEKLVSLLPTLARD
jgi:hypothetical protein